MRWNPIIAGLMIGATINPTWAIDNGQWEGIDPATRSWFKGVRSPKGVPCCSVADGHRTAYEMRPDNHYWVPIEGEWRQVPPEAVVNNSDNPTGDAVVWWVRQADIIHIRCFVRPSEG